MNTRIRQMRAEEGFTLVELLIVIVVLGVLAGVTVLAVGGVDKRGVAAACKSDFKSVEVAQQAYFAKNSSYGTMAQLTTGDKRFLVSAPTSPHYTVSTAGGTGAGAGVVTIGGKDATGAAVSGTTVATCDLLTESVAG